MKKIFTMFAVVVFSTAAFGQSLLHVGANMSKFTGKEDVDKSDFLPGYQIGFSSHFGKFLSFEPGIYLIHKGGKNGNTKTNLNYVQIPLDLKVNFHLGGLRLHAGLGAYAEVGAWGNNKYDKEKTDIKFFKKESGIQPFDFGGQVSAGIMVGRFGVSVGYQRGFTTISRTDKVDEFNNTLFLNLSFAMSEYEQN